MLKIGVFPFLILPWLNPFAPGPSPAVMPLLFSWGCGAILFWACFGDKASKPGEHLAEASAAAWLAASWVSALMGILQYYGATAIFGPWVNSTELGVAYANLRQRNLFASLINIGLVALFWWSSRTVPGNSTRNTDIPFTSQQKPEVMTPSVLVVSAALLGVANAASSSRSGLLELVMLVAMRWFWGGLGQTNARRVAIASVFSYLVASIALPFFAGLDIDGSGILGRLREQPQACSSRLVIWSNVLHLIAQKPWTGWGWGNLDFAHFVTLYPGERFCEILDNAHNLPLHLAVELGVPTALLVCGSCFWLVWRAKPWQERDATRQMAWAVLAVILLHSLLEYPLWYGPFQIALGLCIALLWQPSNPGKWLHRPILTGLFAVFCMAGIAYASWDYYRISQIYRIPKMRDVAYRDDTFEKVKDSWLFQNQVKFAELTTTPLTRENAEHINLLAHDLLHFSPEAKVAIKLIESAVMLGRNDEAQFFVIRLKAAFPKEHDQWARKNAG